MEDALEYDELVIQETWEMLHTQTKQSFSIGFLVVLLLCSGMYGILFAAFLVSVWLFQQHMNTMSMSAKCACTHWILFIIHQITYIGPVVLVIQKEEYRVVKGHIFRVVIAMVFTVAVLWLLCFVWNMSKCRAFSMLPGKEHSARRILFHHLSSTVQFLFLLSMINIYVILLNESVIWSVACFFSILVFHMQTEVWQRLFLTMRCIGEGNRAQYLLGFVVGTICTLAFSFGLLNIISHLSGLYCPLRGPLGVFDEYGCTVGKELMTYYRAPRVLQQLFLLFGVDVLFVALFPIQLQSVWVVLFISMVGPSSCYFLELFIEYSGHTNKALKFMKQYHWVHHFVAATFTSLWCFVVDYHLPSPNEVLGVVVEQPIAEQIEFLTLLQDNLKIHNLL